MREHFPKHHVTLSNLFYSCLIHTMLCHENVFFWKQLNLFKTGRPVRLILYFPYQQMWSKRVSLCLTFPTSLPWQGVISAFVGDYFQPLIIITYLVSMFSCGMESKWTTAAMFIIMENIYSQCYRVFNSFWTTWVGGRLRQQRQFLLDHLILWFWALNGFCW